MGTNAGTLRRATWTKGKSGNALYFNGDADVTVATSASLDVTGPHTLEFWIKASYTGNKVVMEKKANGKLMIQPYSGGLYYLNVSNPAPAAVKDLIFDGQWRHVTATFDGATKYLYVDGALRHSAAMTAPGSNGSGFVIGSRSGSFGQVGLIDEVVLYNRALTPAEVLERYNNP